MRAEWLPGLSYPEAARETHHDDRSEVPRRHRWQSSPLLVPAHDRHGWRHAEEAGPRTLRGAMGSPWRLRWPSSSGWPRSPRCGGTRHVAVVLHCATARPSSPEAPPPGPSLWLQPPPRPSSASGACRPRFQTGLLYIPQRRAPLPSASGLRPPPRRRPDDSPPCGPARRIRHVAPALRCGVQQGETQVDQPQPQATRLQAFRGDRRIKPTADIVSDQPPQAPEAAPTGQDGRRRTSRRRRSEGRSEQKGTSRVTVPRSPTEDRAG